MPLCWDAGIPRRSLHAVLDPRMLTLVADHLAMQTLARWMATSSEALRRVQRSLCANNLAQWMQVNPQGLHCRSHWARRAFAEQAQIHRQRVCRYAERYQGFANRDAEQRWIATWTRALCNGFSLPPIPAPDAEDF